MRPEATKGYEYSDLWVDDSRLVILNARQAQQKGADIRVRTGFVSAKDLGDHWEVVTEGPEGQQTLFAKAIVNAAGPWVDQVFSGTGRASPHPARLVKGSHIVVPKLYDEERAFILPNTDGRVVFVLPWLDDFSLIGTTDIEIQGDASQATCSDEEKAYLVEACNRFFAQQLTVDDICHSYSGVRPLMDDGDGSAQKVTRDYQLALSEHGAPLLSVHGGKLTTYRTLAQKAVDKLQRIFPSMGEQWTRDAPLPGGASFDEEKLTTALLQAGLTQRTARRWIRAYGSDALEIVRQPLGQDFGHGLFEAELRWMRDHEWAMSAEDALYRRSKMGLFLDASQQQAVQAWFEQPLDTRLAS